MTKAERARLLNLYPIEAVRKAWKCARKLDKRDAISSVVDTVSETDVMDFAVRNVGVTKQHVYLFGVPRRQRHSFPRNPLGMDLLHGASSGGTSRTFSYLLPLRYTVVVAEPLRRERLTFPWPVVITATKERIQVQFTIMEKDLRRHFTDAGHVHVEARSLDEALVLERLLSQLPRTLTVEPLDLNRGIKALLEQDAIDSPKARFRKSRSVAIETMDERYTIKAHNSPTYRAMLDAVLLKTQFEFTQDPKPVRRFAVDPSAGLVVFPTFSSSVDATAKVIEKILASN